MISNYITSKKGEEGRKAGRATWSNEAESRKKASMQLLFSAALFTSRIVWAIRASPVVCCRNLAGKSGSQQACNLVHRE